MRGKMKKVLVLGAAGFIGQALEYRLKKEGNHVVSVARKYPPYRKSVADEFNILDLVNPPEFHTHFFRHRFDECYQCAGEVGGLGYIADGHNDAAILTNSLKINLHTLEAIRNTGACERIFLVSSQCVYPEPAIDPFRQERLAEHGFCETDARFVGNYAFAKEKLYAESLYDAFRRAHGIDVRVGRLGNVYGPYGTWQGDRAKSVLSLCRKIAMASYAGPVEIWGDGTQSRSFTYIDDAVEGITRLMRSNYDAPVNIAHPATYTIAELFDTICQVAGKVLARKQVSGPIGVSERASDNTLLKLVLNWQPTTSLQEGLEKTYPWVKQQALTTPEK